VAKGSEVWFSPNLFSRNLLEPEPEPELEPNFVFGPEGSGSNRGSGPNFSNARHRYVFGLCLMSGGPFEKKKFFQTEGLNP